MLLYTQTEACLFLIMDAYCTKIKEFLGMGAMSDSSCTTQF